MRPLLSFFVCVAVMGGLFLGWQVVRLVYLSNTGASAVAAMPRPGPRVAANETQPERADASGSNEPPRDDMTATDAGRRGSGTLTDASNPDAGLPARPVAGIDAAASPEGSVRWADDVLRQKFAAQASRETALAIEVDESALRDAARSFSRAGRWDAAADALDRLVRLAPEALADRAALAGVLMRLSRWVEALPHCRTVTQAQPDNARAWHNLATCHQALGHLSDACGAWARVIELDPENAEAYARRGEAWADLKQWERAANDFEAAALLNPEDGGLSLNLSRALTRLGRRADAMECLQRALAFGPADVRLMNRLAELSWEEFEASPATGSEHRRAAMELWARSLAIDREQTDVSRRMEQAAAPPER